MDIISYLRKDARPVDRVYSAQVQGRIDLWICKEGFDSVLTKIS